MENLLNLLSNYQQHRETRYCPFCQKKLRYQTTQNSYNDLCIDKRHFFKFNKRSADSLEIYFFHTKESARFIVRAESIQVYLEDNLVEEAFDKLSSVTLSQAEGYIKELIRNYSLLS